MVILNYRSPYLRRILSTNKKKKDEGTLAHIKLPYTPCNLKVSLVFINHTFSYFKIFFFLKWMSKNFIVGISMGEGFLWRNLTPQISLKFLLLPVT